MTTWFVQSGTVMAGPYEEYELAALVSGGLRDAVVKPSGGSWVHVSKSPFAVLIAKPAGGDGMWRLAACGAVLVVLSLLFKALWFSAMHH